MIFDALTFERIDPPLASALRCLPLGSVSLNPISAFLKDAAGATKLKGMELMRQLRESMGGLWPEKGIVRSDQHEDSGNKGAFETSQDRVH